MPKNLETTDEMDTQLDIEALSADISSELFGQGGEEDAPAEGAEQTPEGGEPKVEATPPQTDDQAPTTESNSPEVQAVGAPETWSKEALATWATIDPIAQQEILKREQDIFKGIAQYKEKAEIGDQFSKVVEPYAPILQAENINPVELFQNFAANHYLLSRGTPEQKVQLAANLINSYGVDLRSLLEHIGDYTPPDPATQQLNDRIQQLENRLAAETNQKTEKAQAEVDAEIASFAQDPANIYFSEVVSDMAKLLESGVASDLKDAYDRAVFANPTTRQKEIDRLTALKSQEAAGKQQERQQEVARRQAADLSLSPKERNGTIPLGSIDDTLAQTLEEISSR